MPGDLVLHVGLDPGEERKGLGERGEDWRKGGQDADLPLHQQAKRAKAAVRPELLAEQAVPPDDLGAAALVEEVLEELNGVGKAGRLDRLDGRDRRSLEEAEHMNGDTIRDESEVREGCAVDRNLKEESEPGEGKRGRQERRERGEEGEKGRRERSLALVEGNGESLQVSRANGILSQRLSDIGGGELLSA